MLALRRNQKLAAENEELKALVRELRGELEQHREHTDACLHEIALLRAALDQERRGRAHRRSISERLFAQARDHCRRNLTEAQRLSREHRGIDQPPLYRQAATRNHVVDIDWLPDPRCA